MKRIKFKVKRDKVFCEFEFEVKKGTTVLDALIYIKENLDPTISMRYSCRMGVCGSCGMVINGKPRLSCQTQVLDLGKEHIILEPLYNYPVIRDLVPDLNHIFEKHRNIRPYIIRKNLQEQENPEREYKLTPEELESFIQFTYCIKCGVCLSACPTVSTDPLFIGPQALGQLARYVLDKRDEEPLLRLKIVDTEHGVFRCHFAGACTEVCPKGVDPAMGAQIVKKLLIYYSIFRGKKKTASLVEDYRKIIPKEEDLAKIPKPPEKSVI